MSLEVVRDAIAAVCLLTGALLAVSAGIGLLRFPDVLSRMHAAAKPQVLGLLLVLLGAALRIPTPADALSLLLVAAFQLTTVPMATQMIARAAYRTGELRLNRLVVDELASVPDDPVPDDPAPEDRRP